MLVSKCREGISITILFYAFFLSLLFTIKRSTTLIFWVDCNHGKSGNLNNTQAYLLIYSTDSFFISFVFISSLYYLLLLSSIFELNLMPAYFFLFMYLLFYFKNSLCIFLCWIEDIYSTYIVASCSPRFFS